MNKINMDMGAKSEKLNSNSLLRLYKQNMMLIFMEIKSNEPKLAQKQICNQLGYSDSTIEQYRADINMDSPYNRNIYKKNTKQKTNTNVTSTQDPPKNENSKFTTNKKTKNNVLRGGDPNDDQMTRKELIEQAFSNSSVESNQEGKTKFITLASKKIDNNYF